MYTVHPLSDPTFDWFDYFKSPNFDPDYLTDLTTRAEHWTTCACGQLCKELPRDHKNQPTDQDLYHKGLLFYTLIRDMRDVVLDSGGEPYHILANARDTLLAIESRTALLLSQLKQTTNTTPPC